MNSKNLDYSRLSDDDLEIEAQKVIAAYKKMPLFNEDEVFRQWVLKLETGLGDFSDAVAQELSDKLMARVILDETFRKRGTTYEAGRNSVIQHLKQDPFNQEAKKLAVDFIRIEKENDFHDPQVWKDVLGYL